MAAERRNSALSVGKSRPSTASPERSSRSPWTVDLTIDGQVQPYVMGLRKYELESDGSGARMMSRWVVQSLDPK